MNQINQINIKGNFENKTTYLIFRETVNKKYLLNKNYAYLEQLFTIWRNEFLNQNKINTRDDENVKNQKLFRMEQTTLKLLEFIRNPLTKIIDVIDNLENDLSGNIHNDTNEIKFNNIQEILSQISQLLKPEIKKTQEKNLNIPENLTAYLIIKEGKEQDSEKFKKIFNLIINDNSDDSVFLESGHKQFTRDSFPNDPQYDNIYKKIKDLYDSIGNIKGTLKLVDNILENKNGYKDYFLTQPKPPDKDKIAPDSKKAPGSITQPIEFKDYDSKYLDFLNNLYIVIYKNKPLIEKTDTKVSTTSNIEQSTKLYLMDLNFTTEQIDKFQKYCEKYFISKSSENLMDKYKINYLNYLNAKTTDNYNPLYVDKLRTRQAGSQININEKYSEEETNNKFKSIKQDLSEIEKNYSSIMNLSLDQAKSVSENILQIFLDESIQKNFRKYIKSLDNKPNLTTDKEKEDYTIKIFNSLISVLNTLNLNSIEWKDLNEGSESLRFMRDYFSYNSFNETNKLSFILTLNLNLKILLTNNFVRYIINFISNDPSIMNVNDYTYNVSENVKGSTEKNILLPPYIPSSGKNCCFILIEDKDIKEFNKKNPDITNKQIFSNSNYLDQLIKQIGIKSQDTKKKYTNPDAFHEDLELLNEIYFSPHPLKNMFNKHFHKNNEISYNGKTYAILDYKLSPKKELNGSESPGVLPNVNNFENVETSKDGKQISERTYTIKLDLTVNPSDASVNLINTIKATCPEKAKQLKKKYGTIIQRIPGFKKLYEKEFIPDRWHLNKRGQLRKKGVIEKHGGSKKKYIHNYMNKYKTHKRKNKRKNLTFKFKKRIRKTPKKTRKRQRKSKNNKRKAGMETAPTYTEQEYREKKNSPTGSTSPNPRSPSPEPALPELGRPIQRQQAAVSPNSPPNLRRGRSFSLAREHGPREFYENEQGEHLDPEAEDDETIYGEMGCWGCEHGSTFSEEHCSQCRNDRRRRRRR